MNILKKVLCVVLCIIMVQSFAISGFAAEASVPAEDPDADSFFAFDSGVARMDSDGSFTFSFNSSLTSAHFKYKLVDCLEKCLICRHIRRFAD